eukprot:scaffold7340_cov266-Pinguiococcus_pyrenoidosus.AAC.9
MDSPLNRGGDPRALRGRHELAGPAVATMWRLLVLGVALGAQAARRPPSTSAPGLQLPNPALPDEKRLHFPRKSVERLPVLLSTAMTSLVAPAVALADDIVPSLSAPAVGAAGLDVSALGSQLLLYFLQTVISYGVPAFFVLFVGSSLLSGRKRQREEMSDVEPPEGPFSLLKKFSAGDRGLQLTPNQEFIKVERLNDKLDSFQFSLQKATGGRQKALAQRRRQLLAEDLRNELMLTDEQLTKIEALEKRFLKRQKALRRRIDGARNAFRATALAKDPSEVTSAEGPMEEDEALESKKKASPSFFSKMMRGWKSGKADSKESSALAKAGDGTSAEDSDDADISLIKVDLEAPWKAPSAAAVIKLVEDQSKIEKDYLTEVGKVLTAPQRKVVMKVLKARKLKTVAEKASDVELSDPAFDLDVLPLPLLLANSIGAPAAPADASHVYVLKFFGDPAASQVSNLREEVTAVLQASDASRGDEVVLILNTGGGTVTGYGLAASQLLRLKEAGLRLTICVEQVAASGGYMMACTADHLVASPFAVLGSIGVITDIPNVYERLKREGIAFQTVTAGKYKRTLTPTKRITREDVVKTKSDIESVLVLFKNFVHEQRPKLHIEKVATGETWFGKDAMDRDLCDELKTPDDVLLRFRDQGSEIYSIEYKEPQETRLMQLLTASSSSTSLRDALGTLALNKLLSDGNLSSLDASSTKLLEELRRTGTPMLEGQDYEDCGYGDGYGGSRQGSQGVGPMLIDERDTANSIRADAGSLMRRLGNLLFDQEKK